MGRSEIGDKTFFVATLFAMRTSRLIAFTGAISALATMTVIAVSLGQLFNSMPTVPGIDSVLVRPPRPSARVREGFVPAGPERAAAS